MLLKNVENGKLIEYKGQVYIVLHYNEGKKTVCYTADKFCIKKEISRYAFVQEHMIGFFPQNLFHLASAKLGLEQIEVFIQKGFFNNLEYENNIDKQYVCLKNNCKIAERNWFKELQGYLN